MTEDMKKQKYEAPATLMVRVAMSQTILAASGPGTETGSGSQQAPSYWEPEDMDEE